jgi:hypothetical protein
MSTSPLFKRAFVRGLNTALIREGAVVYPSKEAADASADYVADNSNMPDPYSQGEALDIKVAQFLCENLVKAAEYQCQQAGNKYNPTVTKTAQDETPVSAATSDSWALMQKAAAETGPLVTGGNEPNTEPDAARYDAEAALDLKNRPMGYAHLGEKGVGTYEQPTEGTVGATEKHPMAPGATGHDTNSLNKGASLTDIVRRVGGNKTAGSTGSLVTGGSDPNTLPAAAAHNAEAALDLKNRPMGYAHEGEKNVGKTEFGIPSGAVIGREQPHPHKPGATGTGSNTIIAQTKNAFDQLFESTAEQVVPYLPEQMEDNTKVAHVRAMLGLEVAERADYLHNLYTTLGAEKTAAESVRDHFKKTASAHKEPDGDECPSGHEPPKGPSFPPAMMAGKDTKPAEKNEKAAAAATPPAAAPAATPPASNGSALSGLSARLRSLNA